MRPPRAQRAASVLVGVDTGGTFTDLVGFAGGRWHVHKLLSTPSAPARAVIQGLRELLAAIDADGGERIATDAIITYGSTVATNAVLERKGARVVLLTTAGFEDVLEIGRQTRPELYVLEPVKPEPLVPRRARIGVAERMSFEGKALRRLTRASVRDAVAAVERRGARSIAICFLHSYANPRHERLLGAALRKLGVSVSLSHELVAEYREYERLSTTVINAYVAPVMQRHLAELRARAGSARLRVMQSSGGAVSVETASREAVRTLLSGPAAGVIGAVAAARRMGAGRIITFDMGGTSTDVSLCDGDVRRHTEWSICDLPVKVPAIDIHTVGAGGGSLAYRDAGGSLKVGPQSAGADPGPACYGRGDRPTVTDANLVLGRIVAEAFLGGRMSLDVDRARTAVQRLGREIGLGAEDAAEGVIRVVNAGMERAIRRISVERGHDPRQYALVAFGGAAGMHACELAMGLGMRAVLLPFSPGLLSAWGAVGADLQRDYVRTVRLTDPAWAEVDRLLRPLRARARRDLLAEGARGAEIAVASLLDVRYRGQSYEIQVGAERGYRRAFHAAHERLYGYTDPSRELEVVNLRVMAVGRGPKLPRPVVRSAAFTTQPHRMRWNGRWLNVKRCDRSALPRRGIRGPLLVTEFSATTVVPPGWSARLTTAGDLLLQLGGKEKATGTKQK